MSPRKREQLGDRIRRYREDKGFSLSELAKRADVSKGYVWSLENEADHNRPSAQTLYAIAKALGVTMSDLLGEKLIVEPDWNVPPSLRDFADEIGLLQADVQMLASIKFRGEKPKTRDRWRHIYEAIRMSASLDK